MSEEQIDNCDPNDGIDWADMDLPSVMGAAKFGIPGAIAQMQKWERELSLPIIDTVSDKALDPSAIKLDWIEE